MLVPVYSDEDARTRSPYGHEDWYEERQSWKWINTVMRVNSLVQKVCSLRLDGAEVDESRPS